MKERPILFSGPMVLAILAGKKTQTRRVVQWPGHVLEFCGGVNQMAVKYGHGHRGPGAYVADEEYPDDGSLFVPCPYGVVGDRLWVREAWRTYERPTDSVDGICFKADDAFVRIENTSAAADRWVVAHDNDAHGSAWRPPIFMPRWASRLTLEVAEVRVQRLQEISEDDARAEGVEPYTPPHGHISPEQRVPGPGFDRVRLGDEPHRLPFADLWDRINATRTSWVNNPWVWAITFKPAETK